MKHGSLFSGIGGFDLAAEWMGWENMFHCEWNEFGQKVLKYYWPNATTYGDITKTDFTLWRGRIDILSGGFPCQPYSSAGKRLGKEDHRHLWPEMLRAIREISPRWVVGENVRGLTNWNGGMVFDEVQAGLESEGYEVTPFLLPACAVNAPHRRDRIWFVAYCPSNRWTGKGKGVKVKDREEGSGEVGELERRFERLRHLEDAPNASSQGLQISSCKQLGEVSSQAGTFKGSKSCRAFTEAPGWGRFPTQSPVCGRNDGVPGGLVGITVPKHRNESIKGFGNAVVPQLVLQIFKAIQQYELNQPL